MRTPGSRVVESEITPEACVVPLEALTAEALRGLVEEFVTRDGTDYGRVETTLEQKVAALMRQLERGTAVIVYDGERDSTTIVLAESLMTTTRGDGRNLKPRW